MTSPELPNPSVQPGKGTRPEFDAADVPLPPLAGTDDPDGIVYTADGRFIIPAHDPRRTTNGYAWACLLFALLWGFGVFSLVAVMFGHSALRQIRRRGQDGYGIAVAGLTLGYLGLAPAVFMLIAMVVA